MGFFRKSKESKSGGQIERIERADLPEFIAEEIDKRLQALRPGRKFEVDHCEKQTLHAIRGAEIYKVFARDLSNEKQGDGQSSDIGITFLVELQDGKILPDPSLGSHEFDETLQNDTRFGS